MSERRHPHVINIAEIDGVTTSMGSKFGATRKSIGQATAARGIGASWYEVPPGRSAFPYHFHCANDEALYILEGEGTLRLGDARIVVRAGDWVSLPPGPDGAHRLDNTGAAPLRYLAVSTMITTDIAGYPDSKKIGAWSAASAEAAQKRQRWVFHLSRQDQTAGYYDGEEID